MSSSGDTSPQSMAIRSSPDSRSIMFRPISPSPPRGMTRTVGSMAPSDPAGAPVGSDDSVIVAGMVSRGLGGDEELGQARELRQRQRFGAAPPVDPRPGQRGLRPPPPPPPGRPP